MGSAKEQWLETRPDYSISIDCPKCRRHIWSNVRAPEVEDRYEDEVDEQSETIECPYCDSTWSVDLTATSTSLTALVLEYPEVEVSFEPIDWSNDRWDDYPDPEPDPHEIFVNAHRDWRSSVREVANSHNGAASRNRMLFVQLYSIVEAYLSDAIVGLALRDTGVQARLIPVMPALKDKTVSLVSLAGNPNILREMVRSVLQEASFHSLGNVNSITLAAISKPILPQDKAERALLMASIDLRHDCVHRNGRRKDGTERDEVTRAYLETMGRLFRTLAYDLNATISQVDVARQLSVLAGKDVQ